MDISEYRARYFVDPPPVPLYAFEGIGGVTLYFAHYDEAVGFYAQVLGPPAYVEGPRTNGWRIGMTWRTLFPLSAKTPRMWSCSWVWGRRQRPTGCMRLLLQRAAEGKEVATR